ncbi:MAG: LPS assembly lipoprotein LptE [Pseudomonadota bacterium]
MSWSSRRGFVLGALALSGCGFQPLYQRGQAASELRNQIMVERVSGREGFFFREKLRERLGAPTDPIYRLSVRIDTAQTGLAITQTADVTRYNINGTARFQLVRLGDRASVLRGDVRAVAGYSATGSAFATQVAERDARERLATTLAEKVASRVLISAEEIVTP